MLHSIDPKLVLLHFVSVGICSIKHVYSSGTFLLTCFSKIASGLTVYS